VACIVCVVGAVAREAPLSLLVATWGLPAVWKEARYTFTPGGGEVYESCTTLIPLLLSMREAVEEGRLDLVIVVLDSLVDKYSREPKDRSKCYECYESLSGILDEAGAADTYAEMVRGVERFVLELVKCLLESYGVDLRVEPKVVVAPATGSPGGKWVFKGNLWDYQSRVLIELGELCLSKPYRQIILDLSHGVNYMPALTLQLAPMLSSVLLLAHEEVESVEVTVYNSDPLTEKAVERPLLLNRDEVRLNTIHLVHRRARLPELSEWGRLERERYMELKTRLEGVFCRAIDTVKHLYTSLYYPLPLALYHLTCRESCKLLEDAWVEFKRGLEESIVIDRSGGRHEVLRPVTVDPSTLYMYYVSRALCRRLGDHDGEDPSIKRLRERESRVYELVHRALHIVVQQELQRISGHVVGLKDKGRLYEGLKGSWIRLCELKALVGADEKCEEPDLKKDTTRRNLVAHAGLLKDLVEVLVADSESEVRVRYRGVELRDLLETLYGELLPAKS
jgi:CRISPR-associated protein Csx1